MDIYGLQNGHIWNVHFSHWTCPICGQGRNGSGHWAVRSHQSHHPTHPVTNRREHTLGAQTPGVRKGTCPQHPGVPRRNTRPRSVMNRRRTHLVICSRSQTTLHKQGKSFNLRPHVFANTGDSHSTANTCRHWRSRRRYNSNPPHAGQKSRRRTLLSRRTPGHCGHDQSLPRICEQQVRARETCPLERG